MSGFRALVPVVVWHDLLRSAERADFKVNEKLLYEGAPGTFLLALQTGRVAVLSSARLIALRGPGDLLGEMAAQDGRARSATVTALEPCVAYKIHAAPFKRLLDRHHVGNVLNEYVLAKFRQSLAFAATRSERPLWRTADLFVRLVELADPQHPDPHLIPMSQALLARSFELSRRVVVQAVGELRERGLLSDTNPIRVADVEGLRRLAS
ncbi:Crp/Fnr family transcriptional regulator [Lentzea tibetensis]|uniref:Crp/Fnr family transcriptional regulator n=1 Tax=Lentzea tibetensis TaxID=2591470 RepID=A0A563EQN7_9PSEU|nr:Crp/Fnr family transcriptional regulator [Lentzea tibetensis]TWP49953.1 Crp/Fnr family transcriptional regulator [Lentzea tibetensis]